MRKFIVSAVLAIAVIAVAGCTCAREKEKSRAVEETPAGQTAGPTVQEGNYDVVGYNPDETEYRGSLTLKRDGDIYHMTWYIANRTFNGKGELKGNILTVDWGDQYPVIYTVQEGGILKGTWANGAASETLTLKK